MERVQARMIETILEKIDSLPAGNVLGMIYIDGKSTSEIAQELNTSENNVYILKSRRLKAIRMMLRLTALSSIKNISLLFLALALHLCAQENS
jgi:DNA-directed RNA polymerase specialized sigma24 family protein